MRNPIAIIVLACLMATGATTASADEGMKPVNINLAAFSTGVKSVAVRAKSGDRLAETDLVTVSSVPSGAKSVNVNVRSDADVAGGYYIYATLSDGSVEVADDAGKKYSYTDMWMGHIPGRTTFSHVTIPGTHDSAAKDVALSIVKTQAVDIAAQLAAGLRSFDLRPRYNASKESDIQLENLTIYHGAISTGVKFKDAMDTFVTFLEKNPTETVVVRIQKENSELIGSLTDYSSTWRTSIRTWLQNNRKHVLSRITPGMSLNSCRGKIILLSNTPYGSDSNTEDCVYGGRLDWSNNTQQQKSVIYHVNKTVIVDATVEDAYENINTDQKITYTNANLSAAAADASNGWYITYASLSGSPESYANTVNPAVLSHVKTQTGRLGIVLMDFATTSGKNLTNALIAHNQKYLAAEPATLVEGTSLVSVGAKATQIKEGQWYIMTQTRDKETPVVENGAGQVVGRERDLTVSELFTTGTPAPELARYLVRFVPGITNAYKVQFATGSYLAAKNGATPAQSVEIVAQEASSKALNFLVYPATNSNTKTDGFAFSSTTNGTTYGYALDNDNATLTPPHKMCFWASGKVTSGTNNVWYLYPVEIGEKPEPVPTLVDGATLVSVGAKTTTVQTNQWYVVTQIRDKETPLRENGAGQVLGRERDLTVSNIFIPGTPAEELAQYIVRFVPGITNAYKVQFATGRYLATNNGATPARNVEIVAHPTDALNFLVYPAATSGTTPNGIALSATTDGTTYGFIMDNANTNTSPVHKVSFWDSGKITTGANNVWYIYPVNFKDLPPTSYTLTISECGLSTLYLPRNAIVPDEVTAYVCSETNGNSLHATALDSNILKANVGYIIEGAQGNHVFDYTTQAYTGTLSDEFHTLQGVNEDTSVASAVKAGYTPFVLSDIDCRKGFYRFEGTTLKANRAFYQRQASASVQGFILDFGEPDGISTMMTSADLQGAYDLQGRRINKMQKGINILNGRKIIK